MNAKRGEHGVVSCCLSYDDRDVLAAISGVQDQDAMKLPTCFLAVAVLCGQGAPTSELQQEAPGAVPWIGLEIHAGFNARFSGDHFLLKGAPLEIAVTVVSGASLRAFDKHVEQLRQERSKAAAEGRPSTKAPYEPAVADLVILPVEPRNWVDYLTIEMVEVDPVTGKAGVAMVGSHVFREVLEKASARAYSPRLVGLAPVVVRLEMPADVLGALPDGQYLLRAVLDTRSVPSNDGAWRGSVSFESPALTLRDPKSEQETLSIEYHLAAYFSSLGQYENALAHAERILELDETFRGYEGYAIVGDFKSQMNDPAGATAAWTTFLSKVDPERDDRLVALIRLRLSAVKSTLPK
jgi:hypothetical protein